MKPGERSDQVKRGGFASSLNCYVLLNRKLTAFHRGKKGVEDYLLKPLHTWV